MQVILVRHGESEGNLERRLISDSDGSLTQTGVTEAESVAKFLTRYEIQSLFCSPSRRCVETAEVVARRNSVSLTTSDDLAERVLGEFDGSYLDGLPAFRKKLGHRFLDPTQDWYDVDGVETDSEIFRRILPLLREQKGKGAMSVCLVTHAGVIKSVLSEILSVSSERQAVFKIPYCSVTLLEMLDGHWNIRSISSCPPVQ